MIKNIHTFWLKKSLYLELGDAQANLGPVVQSIFSLTSLLMTNSLTVVAKVFQIHWYFSAKMWVAFAIFSAKNINVFAIFQEGNFNVTLANNFIKFWTTGPWIITINIWHYGTISHVMYHKRILWQFKWYIGSLSSSIKINHYVSINFNAISHKFLQLSEVRVAKSHLDSSRLK